MSSRISARTSPMAPRSSTTNREMVKQNLTKPPNCTCTDDNCQRRLPSHCLSLHRSWSGWVVARVWRRTGEAGGEKLFSTVRSLALETLIAIPRVRPRKFLRVPPPSTADRCGDAGLTPDPSSAPGLPLPPLPSTFAPLPASCDSEGVNPRPLLGGRLDLLACSLNWKRTTTTPKGPTCITCRRIRMQDAWRHAAQDGRFCNS